ncbi:hypothetical protein BB466_07630 [Helicobacter pylori]|nr:hypothetical protein BB466_07630 [Helicobacter pylori]
MTYKELGKKVLEQAEKPLSAKEIWERACEMGLDKERQSKSKDIGKTPWSTIGSALGRDKKQFYVARKKGNAFSIGSNLVKENFHHKKPQIPKKKMMDRASVQTQPKNKKTLFMKGIYTHCL